jgi:hypothetical protein
MLITLDRMSQRYSILPSIAFKDANTFDLFVLDIGIRYDVIAQQKAKGTYVKPVPKLSQQKLNEIIEKHKEKSNVNNE